MKNVEGAENMDYWTGVLQRLDLNPQGAWLVYTLGALLLLGAAAGNRTLSRSEWYVTFGVISFLAWMGDIAFFFLLDLLDSGDPAIGGIPDIIMFSVAPSSIAILYLNALQRFGRRLLLSILFTGASLAMEYALVRSGFLIEKGWKVWYSPPFYLPFFLLFLPWHLSFIRSSRASSRSAVGMSAEAEPSETAGHRVRGRILRRSGGSFSFLLKGIGRRREKGRPH